MASVEVCQYLQAELETPSNNEPSVDSGSEDEQNAKEASSCALASSNTSLPGLKGLFHAPGAIARPTPPRHKRTKAVALTPASPIVSQLVEMGFPRKSVESAEKALCECLSLQGGGEEVWGGWGFVMVSTAVQTACFLVT